MLYVCVSLNIHLKFQELHVKPHNKHHFSISDFKGLYGRVTRGKTTSDFLMLSNEPAKRLSWVIAGDGLHSLIGRRGYDMLVGIGCEDEWIRFKLTSGFSFKLIVFMKESEHCAIATWENVFKMIMKAYPEINIENLTKYLDDFKRLPFSEINRQWQDDIMAVYYSGRTHPRYLTVERFLKIENPTLADVRAFLLHEIGLGVLYGGKGKSVCEDGSNGMDEYITLNVPISQLEHVMIDIDVTLPTSTPT